MPHYTEDLQTTISTATQKLEQEQQQLTTTLGEQGNKDPVTWSSLLASTTQAQQYAQQGTQQSAANAASVQVLANVILLMSADAGSILSISSKTDFGSDISTNAKNINDLNNKVAYSAELAAQQSMECSELAAELSFTNMLQKLKAAPDKNTLAD
ncbi:MAG: hypothetical protein WDO71_26055 [Bacteroidota bacterium]